MRQEDGYVFFDNLIHLTSQPGEAVKATEVKVQYSPFTASNAASSKVDSLEEMAELAGEMGKKFTKMFAVVS